MIRFKSLAFATALLMVVAAAGCKSDNEKVSAPATGQQPAVVESAPGPLQTAPDPVAVEGKVVETLDAATYTYVKVDTGSGEQWVAVPAVELEVGQDVSFAGGMEMKELESKTLGRTFDSVIFSSGALNGSAPASSGESFNDAMMNEAQSAGAGPGVPAGMATSGGSDAAVVPSAEVQVEKAAGENAFTVEEIFAKRNELNGQKVTVQGKVVKVSLMIMGKNWLHLQDGTGDAASKTHDLVITTMAEAEKDATVVIEGTLVADKDFGSGYRYDVIIEDAEIK